MSLSIANNNLQKVQTFQYCGLQEEHLRSWFGVKPTFSLPGWQECSGKCRQIGVGLGRIILRSLSDIAYKEADNYIGIWENEAGNRFLIEGEKGRIVVSFFAKKAKPLERSFAGGALSLKMPTSYNKFEYMLEVELWGKGKGYNLCLWHTSAYELDPDHQEALIPGLSKYETDTFLDQYDTLLGDLKHYRRVTKKRLGKRELPCLR